MCQQRNKNAIGFKTGKKKITQKKRYGMNRNIKYFKVLIKKLKKMVYYGQS